MTSTLNSSEQCSGDRGLSNTGYLRRVRRQMNFIDPRNREGIESGDPEIQKYLSGSYRSASAERRRWLEREVESNARALEERALYGDGQSGNPTEAPRKTVLERLEGYDVRKGSVVRGRSGFKGVLSYLEPKMTPDELEVCLRHAERMQDGVEPGQTGLLDSEVDDPLPPASGF